MSSTRLPGKVLLSIGTKTMLEWVVTRVRRSTSIDEVVIATTTESSDEAIVAECKRLGAACHRGSELDVLDRYYNAATARDADVVIRITSDCPFIDPREIDRIAQGFRASSPDYASNCMAPGYLRGLDAEIMTMESLARAWREAPHGYHRVHVTPYIYQNPLRFRLLAVPPMSERDFSSLRWTVDTQEDLDMVRALAGELSGDAFGWQEALATLEKRPNLAKINGHIRQKQLEEG